MPVLSAAVTFLTLGATPGLATWHVETPASEPRTYVRDFTRLAVGATPGRVYGAFTKSEVSVLPVDVTDTANLAGNESPVGTNEIVTWDIASLRLSGEVYSLLNRADVIETANLSLSEVIALNISGVADFPRSDTASLTLTEPTPAISVVVDTTDTASITATEGTPTVDVLTVVITATDTASISVDDPANLDVFSGVLALSVTDNALIQAADETGIQGLASRISAIRFKATVPRIVFRRV